MQCNNCKKEIDDDSKFCEFCGTKTESVRQISKPKIRGVLFNKRAFHFWLLLIATVLLLLAIPEGSNNL